MNCQAPYSIGGTSVVLLLLFCSGVAAASNPQSNLNAPFPVCHVSSFTGPGDLKWILPPNAEKALEILAGPSEPVPKDYAMKRPVAVAMDREDRLFVGDQGTVIVHVFDFQRRKYAEFDVGLIAPGKKGVQTIGAMALDHQGTLYITDPAGGKVFQFSARGKFLGYLHGGQGKESYFMSPLGIAIDNASGYIYISDRDRNMVIKADPSGKILQHFGARGGGSGPGDFRGPTQVAVSGGELFVLDAGNKRVQRLSSDGKFLGQFEASEGVALVVDSAKRIFVAQPRFHRTAVYRTDGHLLMSFDNGAEEGGGPFDPQALWLQSDCCLYVANATFHKVELFQVGTDSAKACRV